MDKLSKSAKIFVTPITTQSQPKFPLIEEFLSKAFDSDTLEYARVPFSHSLYISYSSGTSGPPKCLVHQHGVILQLKKISLLYNSFGPKDIIVFQYSSTSWVLFNIMNGHLAVGATTICYDGSPLWPDATAMLKILERFRVAYWGTSPRYLLELEASKIIPRDLAGASDPSSPVHAGEMQIFALGMDVDVADPMTGESIKHPGKSGELICRTPFPSMPVPSMIGLVSTQPLEDPSFMDEGAKELQPQDPLPLPQTLVF
ncbi:hypothetical protein ACJ73_06889 [Blastomyces percursus]|uniref:AMP-dependent synthetase/ligase domain-containing protein n=1 Tax=Blastomyces percursus TaxID=1658174 RepID=A0A1J9Q0Y1_9EURO|nr:hypothetical protein ACJ73_06889 [Blastomyces percursus]